MSEEIRSNPDELLEIVNREEKERRKGKLKIFLGMAAGVGKTYAMLEEAQRLRREGVDVVVGAVDTHGRQDTAKLLENLQVIPEKWTRYKETVFEELDLDAILKRKPHLILVDELAHSNVPGSRHPKRWQDVMEILDNGIDVYTTLNVQHIESLKDVVEHIAGIPIRETVPDLIIEKAAYIELVDITPSELLQRLKEGKVYLADQSAIAAQNFFKEDRLTALREIILRYAAEKVDHDLHGMFSAVQRADAWKPRERLLVAISHSPHSQKLIRITRRLAFNLDAPWIAVHVDDGSVLDPSDQEALAKNLSMARDLGAEVITTSGTNIGEVIQRVVRQKSVTQIIIGRSPRRWFLDLFARNSLLDHLARECSDIDLHVIRQPTFTKTTANWKRWMRFSNNMSPYAAVTLFVLLLTVFNWSFIDTLGYRIAGFIFLLGTLTLSLFFRRGPVFFGAILYVLIWVFLFIPSEERVGGLFNVDYVMLLLYFFTAVVTGILTDRVRRNTEMLAKREKSTEVLYEIVQEIASSSSFEQVIISIKDRLSSVLEGKCEIILKQINNGLIFDETVGLYKNEKERAAAIWVFQNGKEAGWSTSTLPMAQNYYIPLKGLREVVGVLVYNPKGRKELTLEEKNFLYTVGQQLANYLERSFTEEKSRQLEHHKQTEKIYESILNLIANLFEGPLLTIQDGVKELKRTGIENTSNEIVHPVESIGNASTTLLHILENISAMVNLSAGLTPINRAKNSIVELIQNCFERMKKTSNMYDWKISIEERLPEIYFDYDLIELIFYNLSFHAMEFAPPNATIEVEAKQSGDFIVLSISGEGQSIPPEMLDVAFEKFYRVPGTTSTGLGLGLAIAKSIAEIHGGQLKVQNRSAGGMIFSLFLPIS